MPELLPPARRALPLADPHVIGPRLTHLHGQDGLALSVHAPVAEALPLCLFADGGEGRIVLSGPDHGVWHGFVPGGRAGTRDGFREWGICDPDQGLRFIPAK